MTREIAPCLVDFKERFLKKTSSAEAGLAVGYDEIGEFFTWVEFEN